MQKLALELESIHVETFATTPVLRGEGTVVAFDCEYGGFSDIKPSEGCRPTQIGPSCPDSCGCRPG
jgi:hypothetical protein